MLSVPTKKIAINAALTGIIAGVLTKYYFGDIENVSYFNMEMNAPLATGIGCAMGSVVSDYTSDLLIKRMGLTNQIMNGATMGVNVGLAGFGSGFVLYMGGLPMQNIPQAVILGGASKLSADYANEKLFSVKDGIFGPIF